MKHYIINDDVLCFTADTGKSNGTMVIEKDRKFTVELECFKFLKKCLRWYGYSYNMQREFIVDNFNYCIKTPIFISNRDKLLFFPTTSPSSRECIWICYNNVDRYVKDEDKKYTKIYFKGGKILSISASYTTIDSQITRCIKIEKFINEKVVRNV